MDHTFCPTPSVTALRIVEGYAVVNGYPCLRGDVVSAFPHAEEDECCALKPPDEWFESFVPPDDPEAPGGSQRRNEYKINGFSIDP